MTTASYPSRPIDAHLALDALIVRLAHAAGHQPEDVAMPWREELALAAVGLAGFRAAHRIASPTPVVTAIHLVEQMSEGEGLVRYVRQLEAITPGAFARSLQPLPPGSALSAIFALAS